MEQNKKSKNEAKAEADLNFAERFERWEVIWFI